MNLLLMVLFEMSEITLFFKSGTKYTVKARLDQNSVELLWQISFKFCLFRDQKKALAK